MKRFRYYIEYLLIKIFKLFFSFLPIPFLYKFGERLGVFIYYFWPMRKTTALHNLKKVFPDKSLQELKIIVERMYKNFGLFFVESIIMQRIRPMFLENVEAHGLEFLDEAYKKNNGVVLYTAHIGNWHVMGQVLVDNGYPVNNIVKRQRNPYVFKEELDAMIDSNMKYTILQKTPKNIFYALRNGDVVEFLADQDAGPDGVFIDFFGVAASAATGPALFSIKQNAPIIFAVDIRLNRNKHAVFLEKIEYNNTGDIKVDVFNLTKMLSDKLEVYIRKYPDQYFWLHKRWLTRPEKKSTNVDY